MTIDYVARQMAIEALENDGGGGGGSSSTTNYNALENKPKINGVSLIGNKSTTDLGIIIPDSTSDLTNDSDFITTTAVGTLLADYVRETEFNRIIAGFQDRFYTKYEVNTALSGKVDKVSGKGLSTNDYTTAEKTKLAGLENYDDSAVKSEIAVLANGSSKNRCPINTVEFASAGIGTVTPCNIPAGDYIFTCNCSATSSTAHLYLFDATNSEIKHQAFTNAAYKRLAISISQPAAYIRIDSDAGNNTISNIMIRSADITDETYVPYAPTNRELYEMILALQ